MLQLLFSGQYLVFATILVAIIFSLTLHEFGHASCAMLLGIPIFNFLMRFSRSLMPYLVFVG